MTSSNWPPLRLQPEKVMLMRRTNEKAKASTIVLAVLLATGCVHMPKHAAGQEKAPIRMPSAEPVMIKFDCDGKTDKNLRDAIDKSLPPSGDYCAARVDLDSNEKTVEALIISPSGGSNGDILEIFQFGEKGIKRLSKDNSMLVFLDRVGSDVKSTNGMKNLLSYPPNRTTPFVISYSKDGYTIAYK